MALTCTEKKKQHKKEIPNQLKSRLKIRRLFLREICEQTAGGTSWACGETGHMQHVCV